MCLQLLLCQRSCWPWGVLTSWCRTLGRLRNRLVAERSSVVHVQGVSTVSPSEFQDEWAKSHRITKGPHRLVIAFSFLPHTCAEILWLLLRVPPVWCLLGPVGRSPGAACPGCPGSLWSRISPHGQSSSLWAAAWLCWARWVSVSHAAGLGAHSETWSRKQLPPCPAQGRMRKSSFAPGHGCTFRSCSEAWCKDLMFYFQQGMVCDLWTEKYNRKHQLPKIVSSIAARAGEAYARDMTRWCTASRWAYAVSVLCRSVWLWPGKCHTPA